MCLSSTIIYTSELILCSIICVPSATRHNIHWLYVCLEHPSMITIAMYELNRRQRSLKPTLSILKCYLTIDVRYNHIQWVLECFSGCQCHRSRSDISKYLEFMNIMDWRTSFRHRTHRIQPAYTDNWLWRQWSWHIWPWQDWMCSKLEWNGHSFQWRPKDIMQYHFIWMIHW